MSFLLEYATANSVGRVSVEGTGIPDALAKAGSALRGLECTRAVLRLAAAENPAFGGENVLAWYTQDAGWWIAGNVST